MERPAVTIVVPFVGSADELAALARRFGAVRRTPADEIVISDNSPEPVAQPAASATDGLRFVHDNAIASPGHARNVGAAAAAGEWILFCDDDTDPEPDLLERYFEPRPGERTAILAGGVADEADGDGLAARLARATEPLSQDQTLSNPYLPFAVTANCAFRADAFNAVGGFEAGIFLGEDADLCWRLQRAGYELERRDAARVRHRSRATMPALWRQRMRHGAGCDWLRRRYPGAMPRWGFAALVRDSAVRLGTGARARAAGKRGALALEAAVVSGWWAFEIGRRTSNDAHPGRLARWIRR